jgi:ATP-binding protein involved in chromosome partitioning
MGRDYGVEVLGSLPLDIRIREQTDSGHPTVVAEPDGAIATLYKTIARRMAIKISERAKDLSAKMPAIKVSKT